MCRSACVVGDKIVTFGGSKDPTDVISVIDLSAHCPSQHSGGACEEGRVTIRTPEVRGLTAPVCRTSVVGLQVRRSQETVPHRHTSSLMPVICTSDWVVFHDSRWISFGVQSAW
jgi:hypothetical protein